MGILVTILTTVLVILAAMLILIILLQSDKSSGMGILGGGGSQSAFGSSTTDVLTKITGSMVALFMIIAFSLSVIEAHRSKSVVDTLPDSAEQLLPKVEDAENKPMPETKGVSGQSHQLEDENTVEQPDVE